MLPQRTSYGIQQDVAEFSCKTDNTKYLNNQYTQVIYMNTYCTHKVESVL